MPSYELSEHVEELAREMGVVIIPPWVGSFDEADEFPAGAAGHIEIGGESGPPIIWVSEEPTSAEAYLVALHELGHHARPAPICCGGGGPNRDDSGCPSCPDTHGGERLNGETLAWQWAEGKSRIPITPHLRAFIERRLDSYRDN
jgi:hypothetical protein